MCSGHDYAHCLPRVRSSSADVIKSAAAEANKCTWDQKTNNCQMPRRLRYRPYDAQSSKVSASATSPLSATPQQTSSKLSTINRGSSRQNAEAPRSLASPAPEVHTSSDIQIFPSDLDQFNAPANHVLPTILISSTHRETISQDEQDPTGYSTLSSPAANPLETPDTSPGSPTVSRKPVIRMTGLQLTYFNVVSARANLDEDSLVLGRQLCSAQSGDHHFIALMVAILAGRQEIRELCHELTQRIDAIQDPRDPRGGRGLPRSDSLVWKASKELRGVVRLLGCQSAMDGDVQAYTATKDRGGNQDVLPKSLFAKVMWTASILWAERGLIVSVRMEELTSATRKDFKDIFLTHITLPSRRNVIPSQAKVPSLDTIIVKLYQNKRGLLGGRVRVREEILEQVDHA
ncbi:uncharacterized protein MELLADRAFT_93604 [Melampsora larici-populina 98AG31]|uniref:Uncharacterized protein n=1 Tax=Melampsora larici-populina (strain 98AG31 / pathotype 3-4-7) TaxID=747676 RepID=F4R9S6_MELLP|nr:uncharacterized protein MELLADRAFT_93604 [Melampsora larici-populina 98AG31]EGG10572.1 hypothetical protein MELLADRAFT_93604 [Melampsora larici-populina 98AG31]